LRSWKHRDTGVLTNQLYVGISYGDRRLRLYDAANLEGGEQAPFTSIDQGVHDCSGDLCTYVEEFGVALTSDFLAAHAQTGFSIRANAKSGTETVVAVSANYVQGYLRVAAPSGAH